MRKGWRDAPLILEHVRESSPQHPSEVSLFGWGSGDRKGANEAARPGALEEVEAQPFTQ